MKFSVDHPLSPNEDLESFDRPIGTKTRIPDRHGHNGGGLRPRAILKNLLGGGRPPNAPSSKGSWVAAAPKSPSSLLKGPQHLLKGPGALLKDPGVLLKDPGVF